MTTKKNSDRNLKLFNFPSDGKSSKNILSKGLLITFEGGEGSGKSTQCKRLVKKLVDEGINSILIHEPGNTMLGEQVRKWVKSKNIQNPLAETYLFCAARAELCKSVIGPALDKGVTVIVDRFIHSTLAYQGYGKGVDLEIINNLNKIETFKVFDEIITVTHGDQFGSMPSHSKLRDTFPDSKLIIYGHTHYQVFDDSQSPWVMNPGASGHTRNMNGGPCFSQIHIDNGMWNIKQYCFN